MSCRSAILLIAAIVAAVVLASCGGADTKATPEPATPVGTKQLTPTPVSTGSTDGGGATAPAPADPQLDEQLTEVTSGDLDAEISLGGTYSVDPQTIAGEAGSVPSCDNFQFDFTWQVTDPYPPDGISLQWELVRDGGNVALSHDPSGEQSIGCATLQLVNQGSTPISVAIKYAIGGIP